MMAYPGGKGSSYQTIINLIPPHKTYIEPFAGGGAVLLNKRPALANIAIDADAAAAIELCWSIASFDDSRARAFTVICGDGIQFLENYPFKGDEFVYLDPPYLMSTRRQQRQIYRYEMTRPDHVRLLTIARKIDCMVMISGYWSDLYDYMLPGWHVETFEALTRGGSMATEYLWMNYPTPQALHDYSHLGDNFRERERIKRKTRRWVAGLKRMDRLERQAIISAVIAEFGDTIRIPSLKTAIPAHTATNSDEADGVIARCNAAAATADVTMDAGK